MRARKALIRVTFIGKSNQERVIEYCLSLAAEEVPVIEEIEAFQPEQNAGVFLVTHSVSLGPNRTFPDTGSPSM